MNKPPVNGPLFIVMNAGSGSDDELRRRETIEFVMARHGREFHLMQFKRGQSIADIAAKAVREARAANGVVVAAGGDGTINTVAQAVIGSGCAFGILPQGTFNYFARTHGLPEDTEAALELLLCAQPVQVNVGRVNERIFLVNASLGLYPLLLEDRELFKRRFGRSRLIAMCSAIYSLLREPRQLRLKLVDVLVDDSAQPAGPDSPVQSANAARAVHAVKAAANGDRRAATWRTPTLFVGNNRLQLEQIGIEQAADLELGRLVAITPRAVGTAALFWLALRGAIGQLGDADSVRSLSFQRLVVEPAGRFGRRRLKLATDGELLAMRPPFEFSLHPEGLWLLKANPDPVAPHGNNTAA